MNGHEWAKRQLEKNKIAREALVNGFLSYAEPEKLQADQKTNREWITAHPEVIHQATTALFVHIGSGLAGDCVDSGRRSLHVADSDEEIVGGAAGR